MPATDIALATEYVDAERTQYLHSANDIEARLVADGLYGDHWQRTLRFFRVWTSGGEGRVAVCQFAKFEGDLLKRIYATPVECDALALDASWTHEGTAYYAALPDAYGSCPAGTEPLHRLFNQGRNGLAAHRYVTHAGVRDTMVAAGWLAEGIGDPAVFACVPALAADQPPPVVEDERRGIGWPIPPSPRIR